jgi:hypothetical protein
VERETRAKVKDLTRRPTKEENKEDPTTSDPSLQPQRERLLEPTSLSD